jgi:GT2 family glycosyltransferase
VTPPAAPPWLGRAGLLRSLRERGALTLPLYLLVPDADTWLHADADGHPPEVLCRLSPDGPVRFSMRPEGRVWFSARLGLDGQRHSPGGAEIVSLAVRGPGRRRSWSIPVDAPGGPRSRGRAGQEWRIFLGRFRGEPIEVALEMERADAGRVVVLDNPALHLVDSLPALLARAARRSWHTLRRDGLPGLLAEVAAAVDAERGRDLRYRYWVRRHGARVPSEASGPPPATLAIAERAASTSILVRVGIETSWEAVASLLDSVAGQRARPCEVVAIAEDATASDVRAALRARAEREPCLRLIDGGAGGGIAGLNRAVSIARGSFLAVLSPDGELAPEALAAVEVAADRHPRADVLYSDEDRLDARGRRHRPFFKPDWSPYYFRSYAYLGQLCVYRAELVRQVGGFRAGPAGAEDYDLLLRLVDRAREVRHIPAVLWHERSAPDRSALPLARGAADLGALRRHLEGSGRDLEVIPGLVPGTHRVRWPVRGEPAVTVIIPTRDRVHLLRRCLSGLRERTAYAHLDVLVVDNGSAAPETRAFLASCGARVLHSDGPFNFSRLCNLGAAEARGRHLLFLNNDTEPMSPDWLTAMLELSEQPDVGAVGAKLHYFDGRVQHVGIAVGINGTAAQIFRGADPDHPGYCGRALTIHECAAVTGACFMTRREVWEALGGFDEAFPENFNDVDYCLRAARLGLRVVFTPFARLLHHEFATRHHRPWPPEAALFRERWAGAVDPYYSRNLSLRHTDCSVQLAARA